MVERDLGGGCSISVSVQPMCTGGEGGAEKVFFWWKVIIFAVLYGYLEEH